MTTCKTKLNFSENDEMEDELDLLSKHYKYHTRSKSQTIQIYELERPHSDFIIFYSLF